ncbi:PBS lyase HEAT-like repeat protein [Calothrix parasitica NIES-267]|uniref:PBS lyase HEAT-like repeat protein n=1 Tax=Calothrix parasitica NIES-267 TaxID=1973488 RepID=A0A1Z4LZW8_9CYAN|nr:PBS lyase HEAT-like repeat protein [Calothrix parasitica NIES-267]
MSQLTDSLNQIKTWLEENFPQAAETITPGLTLSEIESKIENLPFSLPEEFYELYQWSGGNDLTSQTTYSYIFGADDATSLINLEYAMEVFPDFVDEDEECAVHYINKPLFPIFGSDATFHCIIGDWEDETPSPIVYVSDIIETNHSYVSLTSMIQTAVESLEANALDFNSKSYNKWDEEKYAEIYFKYNSNILELSVKGLKQHLLIAEPNSVAEEKAENNFIEDIANLYVKKQNLGSEQLDSEMLEPLVIALEDEDKRVRNLARKALEELG